MDAEARKARRDPEKEKFWREMIREQRGTEKTVRQFCVEKGLNENLFTGAVHIPEPQAESGEDSVLGS